MANNNTDKNSILSVPEAANELGISPATLKNWIRLGKIAAGKNGNSYVLSTSDIKRISKDMESQKVLRQRRNKQLSDSNFIPKSYIAADSPNYKTVKDIVNEALNSDLKPEDIISFYSHALMKKRCLPSAVISALGKSLPKAPSAKASVVLSHTLQYVHSEDILGMLYISLRNLRTKKKTGSYYTPFFAVDLICKSLLLNKDAGNKTICDPACGTGNFFVRLPETIACENIYGFDIDPVAVSIARINVAVKYKVKDIKTAKAIIKNIVCSDFLADDFKERFDITMGNPPWGYVFDAAQSAAYRQKYRCAKASGRPESFSLFIEKAMTISGRTAFLVPETIMESDTHIGIRKLILEKGSVNSICYLGDIFDKVQCPCVILDVSPVKAKTEISVYFYKKRNHALHPVRNFTASNKRITSGSFQLLADDSEYALIKKMDSCKHFTLRGNAAFALGIVSGNNRELIKDKPEKGLEGLIRGTDIEKFSLKTPSFFIDFVPARLQQVAPEEYYRNPDKLFYKFIAREPVVAHDAKGYVSLNSANIIIPMKEGYSALYIMAVLNSKCISYYYRHISNNMKVLRAKLEVLPIPLCDEATMREITLLARDIMKSSENMEARNLLEDKIAMLFGLNKKEFRAISKDY